MSEEIKPEVIKRTQDALGKFVKKPQLMEKLLRKPPFRFLHDVVMAVIRDTGFLKGLFSPEEMNCETFKDRESKVAFLQKLIDAVKAITGEPLTARPSKIVAGQEPTKTNELLQAVGRALTNKLSSAEVVEQIRSGKAGKPAASKSKTTAGKVATQAQPKERTKTKDADKSDKKTVPGKVHGSESKSSQRKDDKKDQRKDDRKEPKVSKEKKFKPISSSRSGGAMKKEEEVRTKQPDYKIPPEIVNVPAPEEVLEKKSPEHQPEKQVEKLEVVSSEKEKHGENSSEMVVKNNAEPEETVVSAVKDVPGGGVDEQSKTEPVEMVRRPSSALGGRKQSAKVIRSVRGSGNAPQKELEQVVSSYQSDPEFLGKQSNSESLQQQAKPSLADELKTNKTPPLQRPMSVVRPASARRSARPASARPAAPRIRDRGEVAVVEEVSAVPCKVNVIPEGDVGAEMEEDENFVVLETQAPALVEEKPQSPAPEPQERGHLVAQILETQKELEERGRVGSAGAGRVEVEWEAGQRREREAASREVERLRSSIQTLARAAYPLGKLMDFLHEDVDTMQRELGRWRTRRGELVRELRQEQALTERALQPLRLRLQGLQEAIDEQREHIRTTKASILHNDERIAKLLMGGSSPL